MFNVYANPLKKLIWFSQEEEEEEEEEELNKRDKPKKCKWDLTVEKRKY